MAIYRNVSLAFWTDNKVVDDFTPEDRYFYLYLLTNPHTNLIGCYEISLRQMSYETGYNNETVEKMLDRMENLHKIIFYSKETKEVLIKNWYKYNWTKSEKLIKSVEKISDGIKNDKLKTTIKTIIKNYKTDRVSIGYPYPMDTTVAVSVSAADTDTVIYINNIINNNNILNSNNILNKLFKEYIKLRTDKKWNVSEIVINRLIGKLEKLGSDEERIETVEQAITSEWKDFYPVEKKVEVKKGERRKL